MRRQSTAASAATLSPTTAIFLIPLPRDICLPFPRVSSEERARGISAFLSPPVSSGMKRSSVRFEPKTRSDRSEDISDSLGRPIIRCYVTSRCHVGPRDSVRACILYILTFKDQFVRRCTRGGHTTANGRSPASCATKPSAMKSASRNTGLCTPRRRYSSASNAAKPSRDPARSALTF